MSRATALALRNKESKVWPYLKHIIVSDARCIIRFTCVYNDTLFRKVRKIANVGILSRSVSGADLTEPRRRKILKVFVLNVL